MELRSSSSSSSGSGSFGRLPERQPFLELLKTESRLLQMISLMNCSATLVS